LYLDYVFSSCISTDSFCQSNLEVGLYGGDAYYLGDLNPDVHFKNAQIAYGAFARYNIDEQWALKLGATEGKVKGNSESTNYLPGRNLQFETPITNISLTMLNTALTNVLENALKFSGDQSVDVLLKYDNGNITLMVSDKGIGIPENELKDLFQPFFRATNAYSYQGLGIGLSLASKIIRVHGGTIEIHSTPGNGTVVEIQISSLLKKP
jgi:signal transduction histidine kinase